MNIRHRDFFCTVMLAAMSVEMAAWAAHIDDLIDPDSNSVRVLYPDNSYGGQNPVQPILFGDLDANNDGNKDVVYVADYSPAAVIVYSPQTNEVLHQFVMDNSGQVILRAAEAGDINADGFDDIFIVILETDSTGAVIHNVDIHSGLDGTLLYRFSNIQSDDGFGASVAPAGDVNGDGYSDILIGAPTGGAIGAGAAYIFSGEDGELIRAHEGSVRGLQLGASVAGVGDVDGDGLADYAVGSPDKDASKVGKAFIYSGGNGDTIQVLVGEDEGTRFGHSIAALRGITSDNRAAIAVAAPELVVEASGGVVVRRGCIYLYSVDGVQLATLTGEHGYGFALSLNSTSHDGNTDGYNDLMVSAVDLSDPEDPALGTVGVYSGPTLQFVDSVTLAELVAAPVVAFDPSDINHDGVVDALDIHLLVTAIGKHDHDNVLDVNMDGSLDAHDLNIVLGNFGNESPSPAWGLHTCAKLAGGAMLLRLLIMGGCAIGAIYFPPLWACVQYTSGGLVLPLAVAVTAGCAFCLAQSVWYWDPNVCP